MQNSFIWQNTREKRDGEKLLVAEYIINIPYFSTITTQRNTKQRR